MTRFTIRLPWNERLAAAALALVFTCGFFYQYLPPFSHIHLYSDIEGFHYPLELYAFGSLKHGRFPQWDPSIYCGITFAGNLQAAVFYPPSWLLYAACWRHPRIPFEALEVFAFAHVWLGFLLCYMWLRARRLGVLASVLGGGVFAFGGYMVSQIVHLGSVTALAWMPLGLWGIDEAVERRNWRPLWKTALASAMAFLAGYPPSWLVFCATIFLYALCSRERWRAAAGASAAIAASVLLAMAPWVPALQARGLMLPDDKYGDGAHSWAQVLEFFIPNWSDYNRHSALPEADAFFVYLGLPAIFALGWVLWRRKAKAYWQPLIPAGFCLILATNPGDLVWRLMVHLPLLERTVQCYNFYEGIAAMAALMTALALDDFLRSPVKKPPPRVLAPLAMAALGAWSAHQILLSRHGGSFPTELRAMAQTCAAVALFSMALWTVRGESGRRRRWLAVALVATAGIDYMVYGASRRFNAQDGEAAEAEDAGGGILGMNSEAYAAIRANRDYRIASDGDLAPPPTDYRRWGLASPQGFDPFLPAQYRGFIEQFVRFDTNRTFQVDFENEPMLAALGVRYVITHEGAGRSARLAADRRFRLIGPDDSYYRVYEYLRAKAPYGFADGSGAVRPTGWMPERRAFAASSERGGRFFFIEQFYPGWSAAVDGRAVKIERWNGAFQAIAVPAGAHSVVFEYRTPYLLPAAAISLAAFAALAVVALGDWRRPKFRWLEIAVTVRTRCAPLRDAQARTG